MIKHLPGLTRPETEIERIIRGIDVTSPDELPQPTPPLQVPGFRDPNDPRIPPALRVAASKRIQERSAYTHGSRKQKKGQP